MVESNDAGTRLFIVGATPLESFADLYADNLVSTYAHRDLPRLRLRHDQQPIRRS